MASLRQSRFYALARRLSLRRIVRYLGLWARYFWRRALSILSPASAGDKGHAAAAEAASVAGADMATANRMAVASWYPLDLANGRLHRALLASAAQARPELGITPSVIEAVLRLKRADDLSASVNQLVGAGEVFGTINTALYILLLKRLPDASELPMVTSRHPRHALIAIQSGDEYRRAGRRTLAG
jgi:hypothetical protein